MHRHLSGMLGRRGDLGGPDGSGNTLSPPPLVLPVPFRLFPPPVSQHLCALEVPGKSPVWPLAQKQAPGGGGGSVVCSSSLCWLLWAGSPGGWGLPVGRPGLWRRGGAGEGEDQGHLEPEPFLWEWMCLEVAVWHVWHEAGRRDSFPEAHTWVMGQLAAWSCARTMDFPRTLSGGRGPALMHRTPEYIPGKGKEILEG